MRSIPPLQVSLHSSPHRRVTSSEILQSSLTPSGLSVYNITRDSIVVGGDGVAQYSLTFIKKISGKNRKERKAVFEVDLGGVPCIAKCWAPELFRRYDQNPFLSCQVAFFSKSLFSRSYAAECSVYTALHEKRPEGYSMFPRLVSYGQILFARMFPDRPIPLDDIKDQRDPRGHILVIQKVDGEPLSMSWDQLSSEDQYHVQEECHGAITILRSLPVYIADAGKHNVLYSRLLKTVKMVDFETAHACDQGHPASNLMSPEMISLFGPGITALYRSTGG